MQAIHIQESVSQPHTGTAAIMSLGDLANGAHNRTLATNVPHLLLSPSPVPAVLAPIRSLRACSSAICCTSEAEGRLNSAGSGIAPARRNVWANDRAGWYTRSFHWLGVVASAREPHSSAIESPYLSIQKCVLICSARFATTLVQSAKRRCSSAKQLVFHRHVYHSIHRPPINQHQRYTGPTAKHNN